MDLGIIVAFGEERQKPVSQPSVTITLAPDGSLELALPGAFGSLRRIPLRETSVVNPTATIRRVLQSLAEGQTAIGQDGAPTRQQVLHWERHSTFPDSRCPFCVKMGAFGEALRRQRKFDARYAERKLGDGVTVRRVPDAKTAKAIAAAKRREAKAIVSGRVIDASELDVDF